MYKRKILSLLLVFALVLSHAALVYAAADKTDAAYLRDLKKLEDYLRRNHDETRLGEKAQDYVAKSLKDMNVKRLEANLRSFLRCSPTLPLLNMLEAYAREIRGDYKSIYERAMDYGISPEAAADENSYSRAMLGAQIARQKVTRKKAGSDGSMPPICNVCRP